MNKIVIGIAALAGLATVQVLVEKIEDTIENIKIESYKKGKNDAMKFHQQMNEEHERLKRHQEECWKIYKDNLGE